ncbi:hypothetical protein [Parapedobacter lycopersici]|uniref:hypothetical protein n=1 Tax=Parapedobacter lycopersici TaxID=1864939 RepID=UPI003342CA26
MELKEIREALPPKGVKKIATKTGLSHSMVSQVLNGHRKNDTVLDAALEVIEEYLTAKKSREERFKNLLA